MMKFYVKSRLVLISLIMGLSHMAWATPFYCPQNSQYVNVGMSENDVIQACGAPDTIQKSKRKVVKRIPVTQLTFNVSTNSVGRSQGVVTPGDQSSAFRVNIGPLTTLIVSMSDNLITHISINGTSVESASICYGGSFGVGDPISSAINNCGNPSSQNNTYKNVDTDEIELIDTWSYNAQNYQKPFQLKFVNGVLAQIQG